MAPIAHPRRWLGRAGAAVRFWERNGSGEARSGGVRRGDRDRT